MAKLTFVLDDGQKIVVPLTEHTTIGRGEDNDVVVDDDRVSKRHAELACQADGGILLLDLDSTAGTFVNDEPVHRRTVCHGDRLAFGPLTAVLDLELPATNGKMAAAAPLATNAPATPVLNGKISKRKKDRNARTGTIADKDTTLPAEELMARRTAEQQAALTTLTVEKNRLQGEVDALQNELRDWQQRSEQERSLHNTRVESLRAEAERLTPLKHAIQEAEATHSQWLDAINGLKARHEEQTAALQQLTAQHDEMRATMQRLAAAETAAQHEIASLATHKDQELAGLQQLRDECTHDEARLDILRGQVAELEERSQQCKDLAEVREDQVKAAERKLAHLSHQRAELETRIAELSGREEKLALAQARCREADATHAAVTTAIATLHAQQQRATAGVKDLESRITALKDTHQQSVTATEAALLTRQSTEDSLRQLKSEHAAAQSELAARHGELEAETARLTAATTRRTEIEQQCQELAGTEQQLADAKQQLAAATQQHADIQAAIVEAKAQQVQQQTLLDTLRGGEAAAQGRIEVLHARETDLRAAITSLASAERLDRTRFEEMRQLAEAAEQEQAAQQQQLAASLESNRRELADLVARLTPLRDWKDAMDQLYTRLDTLPQDSPAARDLWHEIEKEKAGLRTLINTARAQMQGVAGEDAAPPAEVPLKLGRQRRTGASAIKTSSSAQETTLRARLSHLRDSVKREETRLGHLHHERARHEIHPRSSPAADAIMREQSRHLEVKIRQEEERVTALQRQLEATHAEEAKQREKTAEMTHKLAELRADIAAAERQRSEFRQQADLAHTELKNYEAALDRMRKQ